MDDSGWWWIFVDHGCDFLLTFPHDTSWHKSRLHLCWSAKMAKRLWINPFCPLFCGLNPHFLGSCWIISERKVMGISPRVFSRRLLEGICPSAAILCSGEPFEESLGQGAIAQFYLWNIRIQMRMADISHVWWFWVWFIVVFFHLHLLFLLGSLKLHTTYSFSWQS